MLCGLNYLACDLFLEDLSKYLSNFSYKTSLKSHYNIFRLYDKVNINNLQLRGQPPSLIRESPGPRVGKDLHVRHICINLPLEMDRHECES